MLEAPLTLPCGVTLSNRLAKAAMTEGLAGLDNRANARHERLYRRWSEGGAGLLISGNVMIDGRYLERPGNVVLEDGAGVETLARVVRAGTAAGNAMWVQLNHPGRQVQRLVTTTPVAPSAVAAVRLFGAFGRPRALADAEIEEVVARFARSAGLALEAGFTGVQVHSAHGYLLSSFLSPRTNRRDDRWGGKLAGRARLLLEVVRAVRAVVGGGVPVSVKLNSADFQRGGFAEEDSLEVVRRLGEEGIDLLEISGGNYESMALFGLADGQRASTRAREAYFLDYAHRVRTVSALPLMLTGGFRTRAGMEEAIAGGAVDVVGLARPLVLEPDLPRRLLDGSADASVVRPVRTGVASLDGLSEAGFYYRQIERLAAGREPDAELHPLVSGLRYLARDLAQAARWRWGSSRRRAP